MKHWFNFLLFSLILLATVTLILTHSGTSPALGEDQDELYLAYPPSEHETSAEQIFLIGTAPGAVSVNGSPIEQNDAGHFAPSFPLEMGENEFTLHHDDQEISVEVTRVSAIPEPPEGGGFVSDSVTPSQPIARLPEELICLEAIGSPQGKVQVTLNDRAISLKPQPKNLLPPNYGVLTGNNEPLGKPNQLYQGCFTAENPENLGNPVYTMNLGEETFTASDTGDITILSREELEVIEVTADEGVARTGPDTSYTRLTPLPKGTMATVNGREGDWLRLQYGAWINGEDTELKPNISPVQTTIRGIRGEQKAEATEIIFPLQIPVPVSVKQGDDQFSLTLHHTTAQTHNIHLDDDPLIQRLDWKQIDSDTVEYTFQLKSDQQWGYDLHYEDTNLILSLKHPPERTGNLAGMSILIDPGHGGDDLGAKGPTGYPEKEAVLVTSKLLQEELEQRGATVYMTRETDKDVSLQERMAMINEIKPTIALSVHYNALPDDGDAINTKGIGMFWYNPPAHDLSVFLHNYLVEELNRPSYGIFWNTLALTRPHTTLAVLLELGFMINPDEFEWIIDPQAQAELTAKLAEGIEVWWENHASS